MKKLLLDITTLVLITARKARVIDEKGIESTIETKVMRVRVPYCLILAGTDGFQEDYAILHDYALIFPESRELSLLKAGFRLNNHPEIWWRREYLD